MVALLVLLVGCGTNLGGSEAGNPEDELRLVTGSVASSGTVSLMLKTAGPSLGLASTRCVADEVIVVNAAGAEVEHDIEDDCSFEFQLRVPAAYELAFERDGEFVGAMEFDNDGSGFRDATFALHAASSAMNLGLVQFSGFVGESEFRPAEQNDQDGDGIFDYEELDDDDDGEFDEDEEDCDLDGFFDFFDDEDDDELECDEEEEEFVDVKRVSPRHDRLRTLRRRHVNFDHEVRARIGCAVDEESLDDETFEIESEFGDVISCDLSVGADQRDVRCEHDDDLFEADTVYTATIYDLECLDGREVEERSWSWKTRAQ